MRQFFATVGVLAAVLATMGCDPRGPFVATYNGTDQGAIVSGGLTTNFTDSLNGVEISDSVVTNNKILVPISQAGCTFPATVSSGTAFSVDPGSICTFTDSAGTVFTWTVTSGTGTLNTNTLTYSVATNVVRTGGGPTGTETDSVTLTRQ